MGTAADMSGYERATWQALTGETHPRRNQSRLGTWSQGITGRVSAAATQARTALGRVPGVDATLDAVEATIGKATEGLSTVLVERGLNSVAPADVFASLASEGAQVASYDDVRRLDLAVCDRSVPRRKDRYLALAVTEGAASSLAVSAAVLSSTVTAGTTATVAVSAVAADVTTVMVGMGRIVAVVAAHYGYDVREPTEQVFAAGVIAYSSAGDATEQAAALASLSRLTRPTWRHLRAQQSVNVTQRMVTALGVNLTQRKLAQAIPVLGAVVNGGLNARIAHRTFERARHAYRLRFLTEKYDLDPARWAPQDVGAAAVGVPLVDRVLDDELAADQD